MDLFILQIQSPERRLFLVQMEIKVVLGLILPMEEVDLNWQQLQVIGMHMTMRKEGMHMVLLHLRYTQGAVEPMAITAVGITPEEVEQVQGGMV